MKKLLMLLVTFVLFSLLPGICMAGVTPVIRSDHRTFDPLKGIYNLRGNVFVQIPVHDTLLTITGDTTAVYLFSMEVHAEGNINLAYEDLLFSCGQADVYHAESTAYVRGNLLFTDGTVEIQADKASFSWKTKEAVFSGNVFINEARQKGDVHYDVVQKVFLEEPAPPKKNKRR